MNDLRQRDFLDELLDEALPRRSQVEPRPGLEERVVARLREQPRSVVDFPFVRWSALSLAVLSLALAGFLYFQRPSVPLRQEVVVAPEPPAGSTADMAMASSAEPRAPTAAAAPRVENRGPSSRLPRRAAPPAPRRQHFPTPTGISEQERLLLAYVAQTPPENLRVGPSFPASLDVALRIEAIQIQPVVLEAIRVEPLEFD